MTAKLTVLTAYDYNTARAIEAAEIDYILVGDSYAMVGLGYENTTLIEPHELLSAVGAVRRGAPKTKIIADLCYKSVSKSIEEVLEDSRALIAAGADIIKIENTEPKTVELIKAHRAVGIEVMGHIGYTPQSIEKFATASKLVKDQEMLLKEAALLQELGVMGLVLEVVPAQIAKEVTGSIDIPTIGIGAGKDTSGQVLVTDDLLGRFNLFTPKFLKRYSNQYEDTIRAMSEYKAEVMAQTFPAEANSF